MVWRQPKSLAPLETAVPNRHKVSRTDLKNAESEAPAAVVYKEQRTHGSRQRRSRVFKTGSREVRKEEVLILSTKQITVSFALATIVLGSAACVSQSTYDELEEQKNTLQKEHDALKTRHDELTRKNAEAQQALGSSGEELGKARKDIGDLQEALERLRRQKEQSEARVAEFKDLLARFKSMIDAGQLNVKLVRGRLVVELASDVLFKPGSARLSDDGVATIQQATELLIGLSDRAFQIEGHTDDDPIRTKIFPSNWELASARALSVVRAMLDKGMPPTRLSAASFAEYMPVAPNDTAENKQQNRRIEIVLVPDLTQLPGFEEMQQLIDGSRGQSAPAQQTGAADGLTSPPPPPPGLEEKTGGEPQPTAP